MTTAEIFDDIFDLPDPDKKAQFEKLIGLDATKKRLLKEAHIILNPFLLDKWSKKHHGVIIPAVKNFHNRPPLILFAGDVGTGKTTLSLSFGDPIARSEKITVRVLRLSLITRGSGAVGEMTRLLSHAFQEVKELAERSIDSNGKPSTAIILVIDEADSLVQSRELDQMHHEDRAGVNTVIRGIDQLTSGRLPVIVVMCTNRVNAIDPAVLRRAAVQFKFERPNADQRLYLLKDAFGNIFTKDEVKKISEITGPIDARNYGYTYSDLTQRLIPSVIMEAFPDKKITFETICQIASEAEPTKPFNSES